jgi:hypothetical protein
MLNVDLFSYYPDLNTNFCMYFFIIKIDIVLWVRSSEKSPDCLITLKIARHLKIANRKTEFGVVSITI